jgi:hypothetical protein
LTRKSTNTHGNRKAKGGSKAEARKSAVPRKQTAADRKAAPAIPKAPRDGNIGEFTDLLERIKLKRLELEELIGVLNSMI